MEDASGMFVRLPSYTKALAEGFQILMDQCEPTALMQAVHMELPMDDEDPGC